MKLKFTILASVIALTCILGACGKSQPAEAADPALLSYQQILKAAPAIEGEHAELEDAAFSDTQNRELFGDHYDRFAVVDLNQDGTPELIASSIINFRWIPVSVFTYADGKAVLLKAPQEEAAHGTFEQVSTANGAYVTYICADNHIHSVWRGSTPIGEAEENHAYALSGTTLTAVDCTASAGVDFSDLAKPNTAQNVAAMLSADMK